MKYALLSVFNKHNIEYLAYRLARAGYTILSTGGTAKSITNGGINIKVKEISSFTGFPEILEGRVKTLHPVVMGSILQKNIQDGQNLTLPEGSQKLVDLDVVVVNLYPFEECLKTDPNNTDKLIENIDIGGITLLRAAAKNYKRVNVLSSPEQYSYFCNELENDRISNETEKSLEYRKQLAFDAFKTTSNYDSRISEWFSNGRLEVRHYIQDSKLKYGCNPHQQPSSTYHPNNVNSFLEVLNGNPGYINYLDSWGCWNLVNDVWYSLNKVCACSFKHTSPAGVALSGDILTEHEINNFVVKNELGNEINMSEAGRAYIRARNCDPKSSFGDFIGVNDVVDVHFAKYLKTCVTDGIVALDYTPEALEILKSKKNGQFIIIKGKRFNPTEFNYNEIRDLGGLVLSQKNNNYLISKEKIRDAELTVEHSNIVEDTILGMTTLKYTQSNSTCFVYDGNVIGIGAGQQNRVDCVKLAREKSKIWLYRLLGDNFPNKKEVLDFDNKNYKSISERVNMIYDTLENSLFTENSKIKSLMDEQKNQALTLCSDGFFPFSDSVEQAIKIGTKSVVHPGGSNADPIIDQFCNDNKLNIIKLGYRYFYH